MARLQSLIEKIVAIATIWVVVVVLAFVFAGYKAGFVAGFAGFLLTALYRSESKRHRARLQGDLFPDVPPRKCPGCRRDMQRDLRRCPHCGLESTPWTYHARVWWKRDTPGIWEWFDEDFERWRRHEDASSITTADTQTTPNLHVDPPAGGRPS